LLGECFGPTSLLVEYDDAEQLQAMTALVPGSLTATVHAEPEESAALAPLLEQLAGMAGRVLWNGWPTGVAVSWAQHHGGPYPATTVPGHTSVGSTSIRRFQRPVCYQSIPAALLPIPLRDTNELSIPRRVNGVLTWEDVSR
jgi:NADP-dependent aldehyde dehydrogenase